MSTEDVKERWTSETVSRDASLRLTGLSVGTIDMAWGSHAGTTSVPPALLARQESSWVAQQLPGDVTSVLAATSDPAGHTLAVVETAHGLAALQAPTAEATGTLRQLPPLGQPLAAQNGSSVTAVGIVAGRLEGVTISPTGGYTTIPSTTAPSTRLSFACGGPGRLTVGFLDQADTLVANLSDSRWSTVKVPGAASSCLALPSSALILGPTSSPDGGINATRVTGTATAAQILPATIASLSGESVAAGRGCQLVFGSTQQTPAVIAETRDATTWTVFSTPHNGAASETPEAGAVDSAGNPAFLSADGHGTWSLNTGHTR